MISRTLILTTLLVLMVASVGSAGGVRPEPVQPATDVSPSGDAEVKADSSDLWQGVPAAPTATPDLFGYVLDDTVTPAWIDITASGTQVVFPTFDDDYSEPIPIGFDFKYYENTYSELYISTNGLVSFGSPTDEFSNQALPRDTNPNNIVTPFWDDLILVSNSRVYYQSFPGPSDPYLVVEWHEVARLGNQSDLLTFEVVFYKNGDILFQYDQLSGVLSEATVGIEDEHGVDGLLYLFNSSGLSVSKAIKFIRPGKSYRSKVYPLYLSSFTTLGKTQMSFNVRNSGEYGADVYDLSLTPLSSGWEASLYAADGITLLVDNDADGLVDTGTVAQGSIIPVVVKISAPGTALVGDYARFDLTATSSQNTAHRATTTLQAAVPAPFAQAAYDPTMGPHLQLVWQLNKITSVLTKELSGSNLSVIATPDQRYIYTWEWNGSLQGANGKLILYTNLEYVVLSRYGDLIRPISQLTQNDIVLPQTQDRFLALSSLPNGRVGAIWVRILTQEFNDNGNMISKSNYNIYFSVINSAGEPLMSPARLTDNTEWRGRDDLNVPIYIYPRIAAVGDSRFVVSWVDDRLQSGGSTDSVYFGVYNDNGLAVKTPTVLAQGVPGGKRYSTPGLVSLAGDKLLAAYSQIEPGNNLSSITYSILDSAGMVLKGHTVIAGSMGSTPDGIQFSSGPIMLGWHLNGSDQLQYTLIEATNFNVSSGPWTMKTPKGREPGVLSITKDDLDHAIATWGDAEQSDYLCYTLIDPDGTVVTPPMIFLSGQGLFPTLDTNAYGLGNAEYLGTWLNWLPVMKR